MRISRQKRPLFRHPSSESLGRAPLSAHFLSHLTEKFLALPERSLDERLPGKSKS